METTQMESFVHRMPTWQQLPERHRPSQSTNKSHATNYRHHHSLLLLDTFLSLGIVPTCSPIAIGVIDVKSASTNTGLGGYHPKLPRVHPLDMIMRIGQATPLEMILRSLVGYLYRNHRSFKGSLGNSNGCTRSQTTETNARRR